MSKRVCSRIVWPSFPAFVATHTTLFTVSLFHLIDVNHQDYSSSRICTYEFHGQSYGNTTRILSKPWLTVQRFALRLYSCISRMFTGPHIHSPRGFFLASRVRQILLSRHCLYERYSRKDLAVNHTYVYLSKQPSKALIVSKNSRLLVRLLS
jgi:hypothetical protein